MNNETSRKLLDRWRFFDPYIQRVMIKQFLELYGNASSRQDWLDFLADQLNNSNSLQTSDEYNNRLLFSC